MGKSKKSHLEGRTKEERIKVRKQLGKLSNLTVQAPTRRRYDAALQQLGLFLQKEGLTLPSQRNQLDPLLSDYIEHLWSSGAGRALASDTLAAVQDKQPQVKGFLQGSWRLLKTWNLNEIPNRAPPLPEPALHAMVGHAFAHDRPLFGLSLLVGFYGMLRTGELLQLQPSHLSQPKLADPAIIALGYTKGGKRQGAAESVTIGVQFVCYLLWQWKKQYPAHSFLCPSPQTWRELFSSTVEDLGFKEFSFRPYSLRRGGATFWFQQHGSLDKILIQGRWATQRTARIYLNEGLALLSELTLPWTKSNKKFLSQYASMCHRPPAKLDLTCATRRSGGRGVKSRGSKKCCGLFKL